MLVRNVDGRDDKAPPEPGTLVPGAAALFVEYLEDQGLLDKLASERALTVHNQSGQRIDVVLSQLGLISDNVLLQNLSSFCGLPILAVQDLPAEPVLADLLNIDFLRRSGVVPLLADDQKLVVAVTDPFQRDLVDSISYLTDRSVSLVIASAKDVERALAHIYGANEGNEVIGAMDGPSSRSYEDDIQHLRDMASEAPIIRLVYRLIASAIGQQASDIHIEPFVDCVRVRYRIDGAMHEVERLPPDVQAGVATRIKILGKLNIAERRLPQDGRLTFVSSGREVDVRISTTPVFHGESLVLRILDQEQVNLDFAALGFADKTQRQLLELLRQPNGIFLVTGPTGSGKTTTLYAALLALNSIDRKIFTVEDPIEYQLAGVNQMQIKPSIGLDFVNCLRSILRQDPDIIMIGEMRDTETASTSIRASLTGHLVLSTLHTNSAAASVTRLLDMGVEDFLLATTLSGVLAQRLVRRLCQRCAAPVSNASELRLNIAHLSQVSQEHPLTNLKQPVGCPECRGTGYRGRTTISELLIVDNDVRRAIKRGTTDRDIEEIAVRNGMETLYHGGMLKVIEGETTMEEVMKVARR